MDIMVLLVEAALLITFFSLGIARFIKSKSSDNDNDSQVSKLSLKSLPGPYCLPILGYLPFFLTKRPVNLLSDLAKTYGQIFQFKIGCRTLIVLNAVKIIREAFNRPTFSGRPELPSMIEYGVGGKIHRFSMMTSNAEWKFLRKNATKAISLVSQSKHTRMLKIVQDGCLSFHEDIDQNLSQPFNPKKSVHEVTAAIAGSLNFGIRFDRHDPILKATVEFSEKATKFFKAGRITDYFNLPKFLTKWANEKQQRFFEPMDSFIDHNIKSHVCNERVEDLADALNMMSKTVKDSELEALNIDNMQICYIANELFTAGYSVVQQAFNWFLYLMAKFTDVQAKVAEELLAQIGLDRFPTLHDSEHTPFTEATILETYRFSSLTPLLVPHCATRNEELEGYFIPEGAIVLSNLWHTNNDPKIYEHPERFRPERFLNSDGTVNTDLSQNILPFGFGKRRCPGEQVGRLELYLLVAATMIKYSVEPALGEFIDTENYVDTGIVRILQSCNLIFRRRIFM